jgi:uncharacterized membrane protein
MRVFSLLLLSCLVLGCGQKGSKPVSYRDDIQPVLNNRCVRCHGSENAQGNIVLTSYQNLMSSHTVKGKDPLVVPTKVSESWLYTLSATSQPHFRMPPDTSNLTPLPKNELELIARWIMQGAKEN